MIAQRRFGLLNPVHTTNFLPVVDRAACTGCGDCAAVCPVEAMTLVSANDPQRPQKKKAKVDEEICLGCGVCVRVCKTKSLSLASRPERVITPLDSVHKAVLMAIERGKLQNLIFDNQALASHRAMAADPRRHPQAPPDQAGHGQQADEVPLPRDAHPPAQALRGS